MIWFVAVSALVIASWAAWASIQNTKTLQHLLEMRDLDRKRPL